jgi:hypothetical protein
MARSIYCIVFILIQHKTKGKSREFKKKKKKQDKFEKTGGDGIGLKSAKCATMPDAQQMRNAGAFAAGGFVKSAEEWRSQLISALPVGFVACCGAAEQQQPIWRLGICMPSSFCTICGALQNVQ